MATVLDSTASVSTTNGEFASFGIKAKPNKSELWTITNNPNDLEMALEQLGNRLEQEVKPLSMRYTVTETTLSP